MLWASWNLACGGQSGLNRCVRFQSAKKPPTVVNAATEVSSSRPLPVRSMAPPVEGTRFAATIFPRPAVANAQDPTLRAMLAALRAHRSVRRTAATEATCGGADGSGCDGSPRGMGQTSYLTVLLRAPSPLSRV